MGHLLLGHTVLGAVVGVLSVFITLCAGLETDFLVQCFQSDFMENESSVVDLHFAHIQI